MEALNRAYLGLRSAFRRLFHFADRGLNGVFHPDYNPLYRSGTISVLLMSVVTVTGLLLVFFYRLGEPWESVQEMQNQVWLGRWLRSIHRYASDATVVAVAFHAFRMFAQGKSWGPRTFSWITGVLLVFFLFISAWTGFVMVWDSQAQVLAIAGARIVDSLGILSDPIERSFNGVASTPPASFFFLNLFLHVVVPLGMIFGIWVHTSKMARATWFPRKRLLLGILAVLFALGVLLPAPLGPKANLMNVPKSAPLDLFFNFWVPISVSEPALVFVLWAAFFLTLCLVPWILKPRAAAARESLPAFNDPNICQGCTQCVQDCPYEAIEMVPRLSGPPISAEVAQVISSLCVSCGLCSASCAPMTMGPPERKGTHQYQAAKKLVASIDKDGISEQTLLVACRNQPETLRKLEALAGSEEKRRVQIFPNECLGSIHLAVVEYLATHFGRVVLAPCPERNCTNKDGLILLRDRLEGKIEPTLLRPGSRAKIELQSVGPGQEGALWKAVLGEKADHQPGWKKELVAMAAGLALFIGLSMAGQGVWASRNENGILRLNWRLAGQFEKDCTREEKKNLPTHMRALESCRYTMLSYRLELKVNGEPRLTEEIRPGGFRADRPLYVAHDLELKPGKHRIELQFVPVKEGVGRKFSLETEIQLRARGISLVYLSPDQEMLLLKEEI